jgi:hypothetical protein
VRSEIRNDAPSSSRSRNLAGAAPPARSLGVLCGFLIAVTLSGFAGSADAAVQKDSKGSSAEPAYPHGRFRDECGLCHAADAWKPARISDEFDHGKYGFALDGAHAKVECMFCHDTLEFAGTSPACASCHQDVHGGEFGADCGFCHGTRSFVDRASQLQMHQVTRFPLTGSHTTLDCEQCHSLRVSGVQGFVNTPTECTACHMDAFDAAKQPDHVAGGFSHDCTECHTTSGWDGGGLGHRHDAFPLTGGHSVECSSCHRGGVYTALSTECYSCHQADFVAATDPNHVQSNFDTDCSMCHSTVTWTGATFDHGAFSLSGGHAGLECPVCHASGTWAGLPSDCYFCHQPDYEATTNPDHVAVAFGTDCAACHTTITWEDATFDHDTFFPIDSGAHRGEWTVCADCHTSPTDYKVFTCLSCHPHSDKIETDGHHRDEQDYRYDSYACYDCHPRGRAD